jgi:hypothetical protein
MSTPSQPIYSLLPAIIRTRDALQGYPLAAFYSVLESQYGIVRDNLLQLYDDQFIETCAPWVIPYIGELIGYDPVYTVALSGPDSRAEVANTIGYRRRKGTLLAMEQLTRDVSGRTTFVVEEFKRLVTTLSLRDVRPHHNATANLRRGRDWQDQWGPFTLLNRTIDVRRIAPRSLPAQSPDPTPLDTALHGGGRFNIPDVAIWMWRCQSRAIVGAPAFALGEGGYFFSALGVPVPLFQQPPPTPLPFTRLVTEKDVPQPIARRPFAIATSQFYPSSLQLIADGNPVDVSQIVCANLLELPDGTICTVPAGKIAIDPELGRIQYGPGVALPTTLLVNYCYGSPAEMAGGSYDRSASIIAIPANQTFSATVGKDYATLELAVQAWNGLPAGTEGQIVLTGYNSYDIDLTGPNAIQIPAQSQLLIAAAATSSSPPSWNNSCVTLRGNIEVAGLPPPLLPDGVAAPLGQLQISGIWLAGNIQLTRDPCCLLMQDSTLLPGREPSIAGCAIGAGVCLTRVIAGPVTLPGSCSVRATASIIDAGSPCRVAFSGVDLASPGAGLHIENSTVIGKVWAEAIRLASDTIFYARLGFYAWRGRHDAWTAPVQVTRLQVGCVRFCSLPWNSVTPRRYECLPPDASSQATLQPTFISLRFGQPGYCLLSGETPLAVWKGASNGSQMGVYLGIQETEAVTNIGIRSLEYLPVNLGRGVFLIPSRPDAVVRPPHPYGYGYGHLQPAVDSCDDDEDDDLRFIGIGAALI